MTTWSRWDDWYFQVRTREVMADAIELCLRAEYVAGVEYMKRNTVIYKHTVAMRRSFEQLESILDEWGQKDRIKRVVREER